jgi:hypothetical protein
MPTSPMAQVSEVMWFVEGIQPRSILDIGIGCGKFGFLCRELLEVTGLGRPTFSTVGAPTSSDDPRIVIDGVEVHEQYITPLHRLIYDKVLIGDALDILPGISAGAYEMVLAADVLEHFAYDDALTFLEQCTRIAGAVLITTPKGWVEQGAWFENEYETHRSAWSGRKLLAAGAKCVINTPAAPSSLFALFGDSDSAVRIARRAVWRRRMARYIPELLGRSFIFATARKWLPLSGKQP